jgi:hypothetical protein
VISIVLSPAEVAAGKTALATHERGSVRVPLFCVYPVLYSCHKSPP